MKRKYKKKDNQIMSIIPLILVVLTINKTKSLNKSIEVFTVSLFMIYVLLFLIKYMKNKKYKKILLDSGIDIVDKMVGEEFEQFLLVHF